jgi:hypothetical protein
MIVSRASEEVLGLTAFDSPPRPGDVWECPTDVMRRPRDAEPHRPAKIEVRQKAFQTAWITDERGPYRPWMAVLQAVPLSWLSGTR